MTKATYVIIIAIISCLLPKELFGQESSTRTIYLMRVKQFYGSGAGMNIHINNKLFHNLKGGKRLIIKTNKTDTLNFQVIYPPIKKYKSQILQILPISEKEIFIDVFYWGEGYNPTMLFTHDRPDFNIEIVKLDSLNGKIKFNQADKFKDSYDQIVIKNAP